MSPPQEEFSSHFGVTSTRLSLFFPVFALISTQNYFLWLFSWLLPIPPTRAEFLSRGTLPVQAGHTVFPVSRIVPGKNGALDKCLINDSLRKPTLFSEADLGTTRSDDMWVHSP